MPGPLVHPVTGQALRFGRLRPPPAPARRALFFRAYVRRALPAPPAETTYSPTAQPCLDQLLLNDSLSDCTSATAFHIAGLILGNAGVPILFANTQAKAFYSVSTGYDGTPATDQGGDIPTVLECWRLHGLEKGLHRIAGHLVIDATNPTEVRQALAIFGNLYCGAELPGDWLRAAPGSVLSIAGAPNRDYGHAFAGIHYTVDGIVLQLWGGIACLLPWAGVPKYLAPAADGELHVVISHDAIAKATGKDRNGLDWAALAADFQALGGQLPN